MTTPRDARAALPEEVQVAVNAYRDAVLRYPADGVPGSLDEKDALRAAILSYGASERGGALREAETACGELARAASKQSDASRGKGGLGDLFPAILAAEMVGANKCAASIRALALAAGPGGEGGPNAT